MLILEITKTKIIKTVLELEWKLFSKQVEGQLNPNLAKYVLFSNLSFKTKICNHAKHPKGFISGEEFELWLRTFKP